MSLTVRNKNRYAYAIRSNIERHMYANPFILRGYIKLKEIFIAGSMLGKRDEALFEKVFIETISYCNNDCSFCPASNTFGEKSPANLMTESTYLKIINELCGISFKGSLAFHCNNEPLLDTRLSGWIKIARGLLKNNFFYLYTNGIFINAELARELFEAGLNRIIVNNYNDKHQLIPSVKDLVDAASRLQGEIIVNYRWKTDYLGNRAGESPNSRLTLKAPIRAACYRTLTELVIGYDGTVPLCCADALWKMTMGNVREANLTDIWFSPFFRRVRKSLRLGDRSCAEICKVCDTLSFPAIRGVHKFCHV
jgi:MoaA/NifB/PqqE/SkfB family radical SAM enzyme